MACNQCAPQGFFAQYDVDQYGYLGPEPSAKWGRAYAENGHNNPAVIHYYDEYALPSPGAEFGGYVPYILVLGIVVGTYCWCRKNLR